MVYLDTSAAVPLFVAESSSDLVDNAKRLKLKTVDFS